MTNSVLRSRARRKEEGRGAAAIRLRFVPARCCFVGVERPDCLSLQCSVTARPRPEISG